MNKADVTFLIDELNAAVRGELVTPTWRSPEFGRVIRLRRLIDELTHPECPRPALRDAVLRQLGCAAIRALFDQVIRAMHAEAEAAMAMTMITSRTPDITSAPGPTSSTRSDARG